MGSNASCAARKQEATERKSFNLQACGEPRCIKNSEMGMKVKTPHTTVEPIVNQSVLVTKNIAKLQYALVF